MKGSIDKLFWKRRESTHTLLRSLGDQYRADSVGKIRRDAKDLCKSDDVVFAASGVCDGYLPGVIFGEDQIQTFSELIDVKSGNVSRYDKVHPL